MSPAVPKESFQNCQSRKSPQSTAKTFFLFPNLQHFCLVSSHFYIKTFYCNTKTTMYIHTLCWQFNAINSKLILLKCRFSALSLLFFTHHDPPSFHPVALVHALHVRPSCYYKLLGAFTRPVVNTDNRAVLTQTPLRSPAHYPTLITLFLFQENGSRISSYVM